MRNGLTWSVGVGAATLLWAGVAAAQGWGSVAKEEEKGFSWTDPIWPGFWMAWTNATAALFIFIFASIAAMALLERRYPGGSPRRGVLGLDTTRGDRLFITYLGSAFIFLGWLGLVGTPLWGALALAITWGAFVFWRV